MRVDVVEIGFDIVFSNVRFPVPTERLGLGIVGFGCVSNASLDAFCNATCPTIVMDSAPICVLFM